VTTCSIQGCSSVRLHGHGLCSKHYTRQRRHGSVNVPTVRGNDSERIKVNSTVDSNGCWNWSKSTWLGYGKTVCNGRSMQAHRFAWSVLVGPIPKDMQVNHKCHNRKCVNPEHLYIGTQQDNMRDMEQAGRGVKRIGEAHPKAKLTDLDVVAIRSSIETSASLARSLHVSESLIRSVRQRKIWKHVNA
jgi:hypothetical protein